MAYFQNIKVIMARFQLTHILIILAGLRQPLLLVVQCPASKVVTDLSFCTKKFKDQLGKDPTVILFKFDFKK
jgi:hypothetical protein